MISLSKLADLFRDDAAVPKDSLKADVLRDFKTKGLVGVPDNNLDISFHAQDEGVILIRVVDPQEAVGYLVHKDETEYNSWMAAQLYAPTQEEILEAANGSGTN